MEANNNISIKDYLVVKDDSKNQVWFAQVCPASTDYFVKVAYKHFDSSVYPFDDRIKILANLGQSFSVGKVYGVNLCRPLGSKDTDLGKLWFFYMPENIESVSWIISALNSFAEKLEKNKMLKLVDDVVWEVHNKKTSFMSSTTEAFCKQITHSFKEESKKVKIIGLVAENLTQESIERVLWHEVFHLVFKSVKKVFTEQYSQWISYYTKYRQHLLIIENRQQKLLDDYLSTPLKLKDFVSELYGDDPYGDKAYLNDDKELFKLILKNIKTTYGISSSELEILKVADRADLIKQLWPVSPVNAYRIKDNGVSGYSMKNVEECFCEVLSYYMTDSSLLPADAKDLAKKTMYVLTRCSE